MIASTRLSVLDRSRTREGHDAPEALRDTVRLARELERLGYHRFWVSEHHSVPGVAGSAPTVLAAAVAAATRPIRVGTGGVMLPNHQPLVVAEQFGVLESLFPGRIDMGLGRSVGFTDGVRRALGRDKEDADDFAAQLRRAARLVHGRAVRAPQVHARPAEGLTRPAVRPGHGRGRRIAAEAGCRMVIGDLRGRDRMLARHRPLPRGFPALRLVAGAVRRRLGHGRGRRHAEAEARRLLIPEAWSMAYSRTHGTFPPLAAAGADRGAGTMTDEGAGLLRVGAARPHRRAPRSRWRTSWRH